MIKPNFFEKLSFKLAKLIGSPLSLLLHTIVFAGFLFLRYIGVINNAVLLILAALACLEAIYLVIFVQMITKNNTKTLGEIQQKIDLMQQEEEDAHKLLINMLHMAHQMKTIQSDINALKKAGILKPSGSGHRVQA